MRLAVASGLTFEELSLANRARCEAPDGFDRKVISVPLTEWACALAGEVGEACNLIFKLVTCRKHNGTEVRIEDIGRELADVQVYLDLLAQRLGIDLGEMTRVKWNEVSVRIGYKVRL